MSDWLGPSIIPEKRIISSLGYESPLGRCCVGTASNNANTSAAWPANNRAFYMPVEVEIPLTIYKMSFVVGTQSGNYDIGIYDETFKLLVSLGSTSVPVAGIAIADITDTVLNPGIYYLALNMSTTAAAVNRIAGSAFAVNASCGVQVQDVGSTPLPDPATNTSTNLTAYVPLVSAHALVTV